MDMTEVVTRNKAVIKTRGNDHPELGKCRKNRNVAKILNADRIMEITDMRRAVVYIDFTSECFLHYKSQMQWCQGVYVYYASCK